MTEQTLSLEEASQTLASLPAQFSPQCSAIVITRDSQPLMTIMPYETHQQLLATIDSLQTLLKIIGQSELVDQAKQRRKARTNDAEAPPHLSWEDFKETFGWE
jgi:hypothetical protein